MRASSRFCRGRHVAKCESCGKPATHVCSGLDVAALCFCEICARIHRAQCPDVRDERSRVTRMGGVQDAGSVEAATPNGQT
jgi:hypothetical protein